MEGNESNLLYEYSTLLSGKPVEQHLTKLTGEWDFNLE
jgi:hypothetical protein